MPPRCAFSPSSREASTTRRVLAAATGGDRAIEMLRQAVTELAEAPAALELARALELAHRHAAQPLEDAARTELRVAAARPRREVRTGADALTPCERRVADLAVSGLSNAQIAARLFITRKTTVPSVGVGRDVRLRR